MGDYRGGTLIGGLPVVTGKAKVNNIPRYLNNSIGDSSISDDGSTVTITNQINLDGSASVIQRIQVPDAQFRTIRFESPTKEHISWTRDASQGKALEVQLEPINSFAAKNLLLIKTDGSINIPGQIKSTLTGVAPMTVASNILVTNFNADLHDGLQAGNASGQIPVSNGTVNVNLNADKLNGYQPSTTAVAGTIPVYNASAQLVGSITGNAATATSATSATSAATLTTARTISLTGDVTGSVSFNGSANAAIASTLANSGVTAGTYRSVTVDAKGRVTGGSNPTTLAGYGITDALPANTSFIELRSGASTAGPAFLDFHTSGNTTDFDTRIIAEGGTTVAGYGKLTFNGNDGYFDMDLVQFRNKMWIRPATAYGSSPGLHLTIGDSDTGINWIGDGMLDFYSNNAVVMKFTGDGYAYARNTSGGYTPLHSVKPITISTSGPSGGSDGDVWLQY